jgi:hydrogenase/urease accessory protein HupE
MDMLFRDRKYKLAVAFTAAGIIGLFTGHLSGNEFYMLALAVLGAYGWANVQEKK